MIEENELFRILLPVSEMFKVYCDIGEVVKNENDLTCYSYNRKALDSTLQLLNYMNFITTEAERYNKINLYDKDKFGKNLIEKILDLYNERILEIFNKGIRFDTNYHSYYIYKNSVPLKYAGLIMLLNDCQVVQEDGNRWLIVENTLVQSLMGKHRRKVTLSELEKRLCREKELGFQAEEIVLNYEKKKLTGYGIEIEPIQISLIDVAAGFDILSYDQKGDNKYIEVKSCNDNYRFYISTNEIETSKKYRDRYWLYLYNRNKKIIKEICNPYEVLLESEQQEWAIEISGYEIHKI